MKKTVGIVLAILVLVLTLTFAVACDRDEQNTPPGPSDAKYTITFDSKGGDEVESIVAEAGSDISELLPADPAKLGLFFGGWSLEDNGFASEKAELPKTMPEQNVTYYARWVRHAVVVPMLQSLNEDGQPIADREQYVAAPDLGITVEVNPDSPTVDLYSHRPYVTGYRDSSTPEEHSVSVDVKEKTVHLYFDRNAYNISFNFNNSSISGNIPQQRLYFGQTFTLPEFPADIEMPVDLRLAGWSDGYDSEDFVPYGEEITVGDEDGLIDGLSTSVTLYAAYDEGYFDFSSGEDFVFLPRGREGVAIVRRAGIVEFEGEYVANTNKSDEAPHIGEFWVYNDAGTVLNGYVYDDGHFAYKQSLSSTLKGREFGGYKDREPIDGATLTLIDLFGCAKLTVTKPFELSAVNSEYDLVTHTFEVGEYIGAYWKNATADDFCLTLFQDVDGEELEFDMYFQLGAYEDLQTDIVFVLRGDEAGLYCEDVVDGYVDGDLVLLDGYGEAIMAIGNSQYSGAYMRVGDSYLVIGKNSRKQSMEILLHPDMSTLLGINSQGLYVRLYEKGDSTLLANCENADGSTFEADGLGNGEYTPASGNPIEGEVQICGELFSEASPAVVYTLSTEDKTYSVIVDQTSQNGNFVFLEGDVDVKYLYGKSSLVDDYVGALVLAQGRAFYLTAAQTAYGNTAFGDIVEGRVEGSVFTSAGAYIFTYAEDEALTAKYDIPTVSTEQINLNQIEFDVKGADGAAAGKLTVTAAGKATYANGADAFEALDYEFSYSSVIVKQTDGKNRMFIVDSFETKTALIPTEYELTIAGEGLMARLYEFNDGEERAVVWMYDGEELYFYAMAFISKSDDDEAIPLDKTATVYIIDTPYESMYAIREDGGYLVPNTLLAYGTYTLSGGTDTLALDGYGHARYTIVGATAADNKTFDGKYEVVEGVYTATFEGEGGPGTFKFALPSNATTFQKVNYTAYFVVNPDTLDVTYVMHKTDDTAILYKALTNSGGTYVGRGDKASEGTITDKGGGTYQFADASGWIFEFCYNDTIFTQKVVLMKNDGLPEGTFNEGDSRSIQLDKFGHATYIDGGNTYEGYYFNSAGMYRFLAEDADVDIRFTIDAKLNTLDVYDPNPKPLVSGTYGLTYEGEEYKLQIDFEHNAANLFKGDASDPIATTNTLVVNADGVYTFEATDANQTHYLIEFIISKNALVQWNSDLNFTRGILTGNLYLYEQYGLASIQGNNIVKNAGQLVVKGFLEIAELTNSSGTTIKGSIRFVEDTNDILFVDAQGNSQLLAQRTFDDSPYLGAYGVEMGAALYCYITLNMSSVNPVIYFDGLGKAFNVSNTGAQTTEIGYYYFGADPHGLGSESNDYIIVGNVVNENGDNKFNIMTVFNAYSLSTTGSDGSVTYVTGLVEFDETKVGIALADDGSLFMFDGYDGVSYFDSLGVWHEGYYNNYGLLSYGEEDNSYVIMDENLNIALYYVHFDELDENGYVKATRCSYNVNSPYSNVTVQVQIIYEDDYNAEYADLLGIPFEQGKDGFALVFITLDSQSIDPIGGFFTVEGGLIVIELVGAGDSIEIELNVDGTAEWNDIGEWFS